MSPLFITVIVLLVFLAVLAILFTNDRRRGKKHIKRNRQKKVIASCASPCVDTCASFCPPQPCPFPCPLPGGRGFQGFQGPCCGGAQGLQGFAAFGLQGLQGIIGTQGAQGLQGVAAFGLQGLQGLQGSIGTQGFQGIAGPAGTLFLSQLASFFGMTVGPSNTGLNDYIAPIAASAAGPSVAGLSAINFPRLAAPAVGGIVINNPGAAQTDNTEFKLPVAGVYRVTWHISIDEPGQWSLWITTDGSGNVVPAGAPGGLFSQFRTDPSGNYSIVGTGSAANVGQATGTSQMFGDIVFRNPLALAAIQIRNYAASGGTVTVTPLPGGSQAQAVVLVIELLGA